MPVDPDPPYLECATLAQAVRWVAFGLRPLPEAFERLERYPQDVGEYTGELPRNSPEEDELLSDAKHSIARQLMLGQIVAEGREGIERTGFERVYPHGYIKNSEEWDFEDLTYYHCIDHEPEHMAIPQSFWHVDRIWWETSCVFINEYRSNVIVSSSVKDFIDVRFRTADLVRVFPHRSGKSGAKTMPRPTARRGPKDTYDHVDFFVLCALEADVNNLPTTEADFVRQMATLLGVVWGDGAVPGPTWLKERFSQIGRRREDYERGRRLLEGGEN